MTEQREYRTSEIIKLVKGVTLRQLQWWDEQDLVVPRRKSGHHRGFRCYSESQFTTIAMYTQLRKAGIPLHRVREFSRKRVDLAQLIAAMGVVKKAGLTIR